MLSYLIDQNNAYNELLVSNFDLPTKSTWLGLGKCCRHSQKQLILTESEKSHTLFSGTILVVCWYKIINMTVFCTVLGVLLRICYLSPGLDVEHDVHTTTQGASRERSRSWLIETLTSFLRGFVYRSIKLLPSLPLKEDITCMATRGNLSQNLKAR